MGLGLISGDPTGLLPRLPQGIMILRNFSGWLLTGQLPGLDAEDFHPRQAWPSPGGFSTGRHGLARDVSGVLFLLRMGQRPTPSHRAAQHPINSLR